MGVWCAVRQLVAAADLGIKKGDLIVPEVVNQKVLKFDEFVITQRGNILIDDGSEEVRIFTTFVIKEFLKFGTSRVTNVHHNQANMKPLVNSYSL